MKGNNLAMDVHALANSVVRLDISKHGRVLDYAVAWSSLFECIRARKYDAPYFVCP